MKPPSGGGGGRGGAPTPPRTPAKLCTNTAQILVTAYTAVCKHFRKHSQTFSRFLAIQKHYKNIALCLVTICPLQYNKKIQSDVTILETRIAKKSFKFNSSGIFVHTLCHGDVAASPNVSSLMHSEHFVSFNYIFVNISSLHPWP
jgi:hypothetical protein